ncbi:MAG: hypothetical protein KAI24_06030, partial [Planctomycetes bacterium]|nr:hypothetical protein [Planctomycetota bacterium]
MAAKTKTKTRPKSAGLLDGYQGLDTFDELFDDDGRPHPDTERVVQLLQQLGRSEFKQRQGLADAAFRRGGVTF